MLGTVVKIDGYDPVTASSVSLRAASHDLPAVCHLGDAAWWPAIAQLPTLRYDLFDGGFGDAISAPSSSLTLVTEPFPTLPRLALADARFQLWTGEVGTSFDAWTLRFDGRVTEQPQIADGIASVTFAVDDAWLDEPLLALYEGTTGAEGEAAQKGVPKPLSLGAPRYVPGVMVDSVSTILQLSAYGPVEGIDVAMEKLSRFGAAVGDYASFAALKAAAIPAGRWATAKAGGYVRHGAPLSGQSSYILRGDRGGAFGWARLPGAIIRRIAELAGASGRVSAASLAALDIARPWPLSLWLADQVTPRDIIQRIAASVNAVAGVSWLGELFVVPVQLGEPTLTLRADGTALPPVGNVAQVVAGQPFWRLALQAERTWEVHGLGDVAFTAALVERGRFDPVETYREGHIVDLADGSRWLYVSQTPGSAAPPDLAWSSLSPATKAGDITYDDGTTLEALKPAEPGATNGAPGTSPVGDRTAQQVIEDLDYAANALTGLTFDDQSLLDYVNGLLFDAGTPVNVAVSTERSQRITQTSAILKRLDLFAVLAPGGTAIIMNYANVQSGDGTSLATTLSSLAATQGEQTGSINEVRSIVIDAATGVTAKAVLALEADGRVSGVVSTATKKRSDVNFLFDYFNIIRRDGSVMFQADAGSNLVRMTNVEVDTLKNNTAIVPVRVSATAGIVGSSGASGDLPASASVARMTVQITMKVPGWIEVTAGCKQDFADTGGSHPWVIALDVNGTLLPEAYVFGQRPADGPVVLGAYYASSAGTYTVSFRWQADNSVTLRNRTMFVKGFPFTE